MTHEAGVEQQHETQMVDTHVLDHPMINEALADCQRIEGSGPPENANILNLPKWLQIFFLSIMIVLALMAATGIISSILR